MLILPTGSHMRLTALLHHCALLRSQQHTAPHLCHASASPQYFHAKAMSFLALTYDKPGEPAEVLGLTELPVLDCKGKEVEVQFLKAPINPSDINTIQGKYPLQPPLPQGVPGHEGVGRVLCVGAQVQGLSPGDLVVNTQPCLGTWRQRGTFPAHAFHKVPKDLAVDAAATLCINPPTALAMLENYVDLQPGDVVIQNGATSAVGHAVVQIAKAKGLRTVNVIRERPNWDETVAELKQLGADVVTTDAKLKADMEAANLPAPALGLNCVGGSSALALAKALRPGGTLVTYGGMSMQPVTIPTSLLIFKDLTFKGFWLSGRSAPGHEQRGPMLDRLVEMMQKGQLQPVRTESFPLRHYQEALQASQQERRGFKVLLDLTQEAS